MINYLRISLGITVLIFGALTLNSCQKIMPEVEAETKLTVSMDNMVEIKEEIELDNYGYNVKNVKVQEGRVKRNESLYIILREMDVSPQTIYEIDKKSKGIFQSNRIKPGQRYLAYKDNDKAYRLILHSDALNYVIFDWKDDVQVFTGKKELTKQIAQAKGVIESSLYETLQKQDKNIMLGNLLSEVFAWQIDFFRLYPGDEFKVIYEKQFVDGKPFGLGRVLAAEFTNKGTTYKAYFYDNEEYTGYYDSEGKGVQKALMKVPFKYSHRISSGFSHNRFHPVLKQRRPHYGVDYAAPKGTPVLSVGDGEIVEARYRGASGNIVKVRHNGVYTTAYLHLNGFASGIKSGVRVKQGQVIGYVGNTGRVTGVHLDYRIYKNGHPVNPLTVELPPSKSIHESEMDDYKAKIQPFKQQLEELDEQKSEAKTTFATVIN